MCTQIEKEYWSYCNKDLIGGSMRWLSRILSDARNHCGWDHSVHATHGVAAAQAKIAALAPVLAPWVLNYPVRLVLESQNREPFSSIPNQQHSMIQTSLTAYKRTWHSPYVCLHVHRIYSHCKHIIIYTLHSYATAKFLT